MLWPQERLMHHATWARSRSALSMHCMCCFEARRFCMSTHDSCNSQKGLMQTMRNHAAKAAHCQPDIQQRCLEMFGLDGPPWVKLSWYKGVTHIAACSVDRHEVMGSGSTTCCLVATGSRGGKAHHHDVSPTIARQSNCGACHSHSIALSSF